jgi:hypothetical protein
MDAIACDWAFLFIECLEHPCHIASPACAEVFSQLGQAIPRLPRSRSGRSKLLLLLSRVLAQNTIRSTLQLLWNTQTEALPYQRGAYTITKFLPSSPQTPLATPQSKNRKPSNIPPASHPSQTSYSLHRSHWPAARQENSDAIGRIMRVTVSWNRDMHRMRPMAPSKRPKTLYGVNAAQLWWKKEMEGEECIPG